MTPDQEKDFDRNPKFERRVVVFYDVLGWRGVTESTQGDAGRIGELRRIILLHHRILNQPVEVPVNVSTFSDNVVISVPADKNVPYLLREITLMQLLTQSHGLLLRGGVTIGDIVHDKECIFGPGLNRAYDLERTVAKYPRIIIEPDVLKCGEMQGFHDFDGEQHFLDPFSESFLDYLTEEGAIESPAHVWKEQYEAFLEVLQSPLDDRQYEKIAWVIDRIAHHTNLKPSSAYPRKKAAGGA
jgi:hypothetical protein